MVYLNTNIYNIIYNKHQQNVGKYTIPMDPMEYCVFFQSNSEEFQPESSPQLTDSVGSPRQLGALIFLFFCLEKQFWAKNPLEKNLKCRNTHQSNGDDIHNHM